MSKTRFASQKTTPRSKAVCKLHARTARRRSLTADRFDYETTRTLQNTSAVVAETRGLYLPIIALHCTSTRALSARPLAANAIRAG